MDDDIYINLRLLSKEEKYGISNVEITVNEYIEAESLNETVNQSIKDTQDIVKPVDFEFVIGGDLLRKPLGKHLEDKSISKHVLIDVECIRKTTKPEYEDSILLDDWVSSIDICAGKWILAGCYDNNVYLWNSLKKSIVPLGNHSNPVKDVKWISKDETVKGFVSASYDQTAILWFWEEERNDVNNVKAIFTLNGHSRGIDCVGVSPDAQYLATGSRDTNIKVWSAKLEREGEPAPKRRRSDTNVDLRDALSTLEGHEEAVTALEWVNNTNIISCSMDQSLKFWDVEVNEVKNELLSQRSILSLNWSPLSNNLLTGSADQYIRMLDLRLRHCDGALLFPNAHWTSSVKWSSSSEYLFVSGGYDGKVKMWDTRHTGKELFVLEGHKGQVLNVNWSNNDCISSSGTDNYVHMYKN